MAGGNIVVPPAPAAPEPPAPTTCTVCGARALYAGTQDRVRFYACTVDPSHVTSVLPVGMVGLK